MEPPQVDPSPADPPHNENVPARGVSVTVVDEEHSPGAVHWGHVASVVAVLALAAGVFVTVLGSGQGHGRASPPTRTTTHRLAQFSSPPASGCIHTPGYGGLGGRPADFAGNNNGSTGPAEPTPGAAWYVVGATVRGCVSAVSLQDGGSPPVSAHDLLLLVSHQLLPRDARAVLQRNHCVIWRSVTLGRAMGTGFATATAVAQAGTVPGSAAIEAASTPTC